MTIRFYTGNWELTLIVLAVVVLIGLLVAAWCKTRCKKSRQEEKEHPCAYCQRWGECNGVDEECPLLLAYEEAMRAAANKDYYRDRHRVKKRGDGDGK